MYATRTSYRIGSSNLEGLTFKARASLTTLKKDKFRFPVSIWDI